MAGFQPGGPLCRPCVCATYIPTHNPRSCAAKLSTYLRIYNYFSVFFVGFVATSGTYQNSDDSVDPSWAIQVT